MEVDAIELKAIPNGLLRVYSHGDLRFQFPSYTLTNAQALTLKGLL